MGIFGAGTDSPGIRPVGLVNGVSINMNDIDGTEERSLVSALIGVLFGVLLGSEKVSS